MANYESNFKHPITYQETNTLSDKIIEDLELTKFNDPEKKMVLLTTLRIQNLFLEKRY